MSDCDMQKMDEVIEGGLMALQNIAENLEELDPKK